MRSTRTLATILTLLIFSMACFFIVKYKEDISKFVIKTIRKYTTNKVIVPDYSKNHRLYDYKTVSETDNFVPHNIDDIKKIYYTVLNNGWESFTFYCPYDYENCVDDVKMIAKSDKDSFIALINSYVSPYNSYKKYNTLVVGEDTVNLTIEKVYTDDEIDKINQIVDDYIKKNITSSKITQKDIEKAHDYLLKKIKYDEAYVKTDVMVDSNKATGALFNGKALCSGYADAFAIFLDKMNVPNFKVNSEDHEWNVVYFNNKWSHIDVTWDDDEINKNNNRNFFMINTTELLKKDKIEHNFDQNLYLELK